MASVPTITALPTLPVVGSATFEDDVNALMNALINTFVTEVNASIAAINSLGTFPALTRVFKVTGDLPYTTANGEVVYVDLTSGIGTVTLPASPSAGNYVMIVDYKGTFATNTLTVGRNSEKIEGNAADATSTIAGTQIHLVYTGASYGWTFLQS